MRKKKRSVISSDSLKTASSLKFENYIDDSSWLSQQLLAYYKHKSLKLIKDYDELLEVLDNIKSTCDLSNELQLEIRSRNEEISKLQQLVGDLQVRLFQEREENLILIAENDKLKIQNYQNKKKINLLLMVNGMTEKKFCHFLTTDLEEKFVESKLPLKLQKLKEQNNKIMCCKCVISDCNQSCQKDNDLEVLAMNNQVLSAQLNQHIKVTKEQIEVLLKEKELINEEKIVGIHKVQKEVDILSSKLKENQELLCSTAEKLINSERSHEKNKAFWMEEKEKYNRIINFLKIQLGENVSDVFNYDDIAKMLPNENEVMHQRIFEKDKLISSYEEKISELQEEIGKLTENGKMLKKLFKEKTEKMSAHIIYLKSKYEDLDRRRHLEAEGFHSDIKILRDRLKAVDKKLVKASNGIQNSEQQQLLISARNTLNRAKLLEKELASMKSKISSLESNTELSTL